MCELADFSVVQGVDGPLVSRLHPVPAMTAQPWQIEETVPTAPPLFVRRSGGWDPRRVSVMMLPVVPALFLVFLVQIMESTAPGIRVPIRSLTNFGAVEIADESALRERPSGLRGVYTRQESRAIEVARFLHMLNPDFPETDLRRFSALLVRLGEHYRCDPSLVVAVIMTESSFDPRSRSHMGALGLMQILPKTGESLAVETQRRWSGEHTLFDPYLNISLGVRYLAKLQKRFGTLEIALTAYNYGPSRVEAWLRRGDALPMDYAQRVLARYRQFRRLASTSSL